MTGRPVRGTIMAVVTVTDITIIMSMAMITGTAITTMVTTATTTNSRPR